MLRIEFLMILKNGMSKVLKQLKIDLVILFINEISYGEWLLMAKKPPRVVKKIVGRSRRSLRMTKTARAGQRYLIFAEKDSNSELEFPESVNDLRSYIYTYSVISNDVANIVPSKTLRKLTQLT